MRLLLGASAFLVIAGVAYFWYPLYSDGSKETAIGPVPRVPLWDHFGTRGLPLVLVPTVAVAVVAWLLLAFSTNRTARATAVAISVGLLLASVVLFALIRFGVFIAPCAMFLLIACGSQLGRPGPLDPDGGPRSSPA
jgi:hypothetical protein